METGDITKINLWGDTMNSLKALTILVLLSIASVQAHAHHAWAAIFDANGDVEIEGVVSKILWRNPHVQFQITVDQDTANETVWTIESNAVARLTRMGVSRDVIQIGDQVKAAGLPSLQGRPEMFVNHLLLADNTEVVMSRTAGRRWTDEASGLIGDTAALHGGLVEENLDERPTSIFGSWHIVYGAEGSHGAGRARGGGPTEYALEYQAARQAAGLGGRPDRHDCSARPALSVIGEPYPMALVNNGDTIEIQFEFLDTVRTVYMDPTKAIPSEIPRDHLGYSRGRMLGDTLVVETIQYREGGTDGLDFVQAVETFNLSHDRNQLAYTRVEIDPLMQRTSNVAQKWWQYVPGQEIQPYDCAGSITEQ
jgi:hypothetical protein